MLLASGTGSLTQAVLDRFVDPSRNPDPASGVEIVAVGSDKPEAPVLERAAARGVPTFVVDPRSFPDRAAWNSALTATVGDLAPDWVLSAGFMRILGEEFVSAFPQRIINTHPALLPSFPGAHGVRDALAHGVTVTGTTIHLVDTGVDTGPIIAQFPVRITSDDSEETLHEKIKDVERTRIVEFLEFLSHGRITVEGRRVRGYEPN